MDNPAYKLQPSKPFEVQFGPELNRTTRFHSFELAMAFAEGWKAGRDSAGLDHDFRIVNLAREEDEETE